MTAAGGSAALVVVATILYLQLGRPDLTTSTPMAHANIASSSQAPSSIEQATEKLAKRLSREGGSDSDWELLAQSYDFMGHPDDAARARQHLTANSAPNSSADITNTLAQAQALRTQRNFEQARAAYEKAIGQNGMTAEAWADYADVLASQSNNKLSGAPARAIDNALALDPNQPKALWLKASLAHEEHRYADAVALWKRLRSLMDDSSSDARIIDANIAEAQQLAGNAPLAKQTASVAVSGTVEIDPRLASRAAPGSTLFIYAKSVDSPGPPLAVFRTTVAKWPMQFTLDDSMAMMPGRNLSSAGNVIIEARISRSGQATATSGDLQAAGARINPRDSKAVHLRIDKEVS
jgi:cytochrome c-type biogenesis protein CcmH